MVSAQLATVIASSHPNFDRLHGTFHRRTVAAGARRVMADSTERFLRAISL
jgi:hypothetical protein